MIEEIKKEIEQSKCIFDIKYFKNDNINDYELIGKGISLVKLFEILNKYNKQPDYKSEMLYIGRRTGKTLQQINNMVNYIKENNLTECNIKVLEVPNDYQKALEELKEWFNTSTMRNRVVYGKLEWTDINYKMQELEQKYKLGGE